MNHRGMAIMIVVPASLSLATGCGGQATQPASTPASEAWSTPVTSVQLPTGSRVSLQITRSDAKSGAVSRCWRVTESTQGHERGSTSACHAQTANAAARVFGTVVVVSSCTTSSGVTIAGSQGKVTQRDVFDGMFLVTPGALPVDAKTITYSCIGPDGQEGQAVELRITQ
jgi:hypothetical protein